MIKKISVEEFVDFCTEFTKNYNPNLRFGQAFVNKYFPDIACPEIYYETDYYTAFSLIVDTFVDVNGENKEKLWNL